MSVFQVKKSYQQNEQGRPQVDRVLERLHLSQKLIYVCIGYFSACVSFLADRTAALSMIGYWRHTVVYLSVCQSARCANLC